MIMTSNMIVLASIMANVNDDTVQPYTSTNEKVPSKLISEADLRALVKGC